MPCKSAIFLMFTRRLGVVMSSFMSESRSVPPARTSTSPQFLPSSGMTCSLVFGLAYSNARMATSLIECRHNAIGCDGQKWNADANSIGHGIGNGRSWTNRRRLAQTDGPSFVVAFASHHVYNQLRNVTDPRQPVKIHIGIQHAAGSRIHDFLFVQCGGNTHDQCAVTLAFSGFHVDD